MAIRHYSEIEGYDGNGNLVKPGLVIRQDGISKDIYGYDPSSVIRIGTEINIIGGSTGVVVGSNNKFTKTNCIVLGNNNETTTDNQLIVGQWNDTSKLGYIIVGTGEGDDPNTNKVMEEKRRSGFRVEASKGNAIVHIEGDLCMYQNNNDSGCTIRYEDNAIKFVFPTK